MDRKSLDRHAAAQFAPRVERSIGVTTSIFCGRLVQAFAPAPRGNRSMMPRRVLSPWFDVAIWQLDLDLFAPLSLAELTPDEVAHCHQLHRHADRIRFAETRRWLRRLLGSRLGIAPAAVTFTSNSFGKPAVMAQSTTQTLHFSVSHAHEIALIGLSAVAEIGLDIEPLTALPQLLEIATTVLSNDEFNRWCERESCSELLRTWVAKEAALKAIGCGIGEHLHHVELIDGQLCIAAPLAELTQSLIYTPLNQIEGYVAACARYTRNPCSVSDEIESVSAGN